VATAAIFPFPRPTLRMSNPAMATAAIAAKLKLIKGQRHQTPCQAYGTTLVTKFTLAPKPVTYSMSSKWFDKV